MNRPARKRAYFGKFPEEYNSYSNLYRVFNAMVERCTKPTIKNYHNYGGRGIKVCNEWIGNYQSFCDWALENGYKKGLQIDRIDNNGNYEPSNCRWVTQKQNCNNTRFNFNKSLGNKAVDKHNSLGKGTNIYFACGFSLSSDFPTLSMQELLAKADEPMYEDKQRWYDKHTQDFL